MQMAIADRLYDCQLMYKKRQTVGICIKRRECIFFLVLGRRCIYMLLINKNLSYKVATGERGVAMRRPGMTVFFPLNVNTTLKDCFDEPNQCLIKNVKNVQV